MEFQSDEKLFIRPLVHQEIVDDFGKPHCKSTQHVIHLDRKWCLQGHFALLILPFDLSSKSVCFPICSSVLFSPRMKSSHAISVDSLTLNWTLIQPLPFLKIDEDIIKVDELQTMTKHKNFFQANKQFQNSWFSKQTRGKT